MIWHVVVRGRLFESLRGLSARQALGMARLYGAEWVFGESESEPGRIVEVLRIRR